MPMISVWRWQDAPQEYRDLSPHGGDEDWVAHIPVELVEIWIPWMDGGTEFGCCEVSTHDMPDGSQIRIGAHS